MGLRRLALAAVVTAASAAAVHTLLWATADGLAALHSGTVANTDEIVGLVALAGVWIAVLWLTAGFAVALIGAIPARRGGRCDRIAVRVTPLPLRRLARLLVGATVVTCGVALPYGSALAETSAPPLPDLDRPTAPAISSADPTLSPVDARPDPMDPASDQPTGSDGERRTVIVVAPGDTLWNIAADHLESEASNADIAREWPRWYSANRDVIGADPDLILPGQRLHPPAVPASRPTD